MRNALFINGVHEKVLAGIDAKRGSATEAPEYFLQPHSDKRIRMLHDAPPSANHAVRLYLSTSKYLAHISYTAEIVRWENKKELGNRRRSKIRQQLQATQPSELALFDGTGKLGDKPINLLTIRGLQKLKKPRFVETTLVKVSNKTPYKTRTQSGNWSEVFDVGDLSDTITTEDSHINTLNESIKRSLSLSDEQLQRRLRDASPTPSRIAVTSIVFRRNPDVIAATLRRADGQCEGCHTPAPFNRRSDGLPYLEVHHTRPLSEGGDDTVNNAVALCPNCHRKAHYS